MAFPAKVQPGILGRGREIKEVPACQWRLCQSKLLREALLQLDAVPRRVIPAAPALANAAVRLNQVLGVGGEG